MSFLTPGFFDALVLVVIVVGIVLAVIRINKDFRQGPRWPESTFDPTSDDVDELSDTPQQETKP